MISWNKKIDLFDWSSSQLCLDNLGALFWSIDKAFISFITHPWKTWLTLGAWSFSSLLMIFLLFHFFPYTGKVLTYFWKIWELKLFRERPKIENWSVYTLHFNGKNLSNNSSWDFEPIFDTRNSYALSPSKKNYSCLVFFVNIG